MKKRLRRRDVGSGSQERRPYLMGVAIGALATLVAAIAAALASFWFK
jgi:hypothetical protein